MSDMTLKFRWSLQNNGLAGIPADRWWQLLKQNNFEVDPVYYHRVAFLTALSLINSVYRHREERIYGAAVEKTEIVKPPIVILGHYRSGTTHLHSLLGVDDAHFAYSTTYQTSHPYSFLCGEASHARILEPFLSKKRPMDNMALSLRTPQEEEYALSLASFCSPFLAYSFPRRYDWYIRYLTFNDATAEEIARWQAGLIWFVKKLTFRYKHRQLILKSPPHTARIKLIREIFPDAYFINIYRNPYVVYQSSRHLYNIVPWYMYLQRPDVGYTDERIIQKYTMMYDNFFRDKDTIPSDHFHEVRFEDLERDPMREIATIYEKFGFDHFGEMEPKLRKYLDRIAGYKKNVYPDIPPPLKERLAKAWRRNFEAWDYEI